MKTVRHVVWVHDSASEAGGAERYVFETARHLRERGVRSTLLYDVSKPASPSVLEAFDKAFPLVSPEAQLAALAPDVIYAHRPPGGRLDEAFIRHARRVVRFIHDYQMFCLREHKYTTVGRVACDRPVGLGCYACLGCVGRSASFPGVRLRTVRSLLGEQQRNQRLARFVVAAREVADEAARNGFDPGKIRVVPLYTDAPREAPSPDRRALDEVLYVGALTRGKGLDVLLEALSIAPRALRLTVVGKGPQEAEWKALAARLGLLGRVSFAGALPPPELAALYRRAACLAMPARAPETFGLVGLEAMSHATPVIASDVGGIRAWLAHGETGLLVPAGSSAALASALDQLAGNPTLCRAMGEAGKARHRAMFLPQHHVEPLLDLLSEVAQEAA